MRTMQICLSRNRLTAILLLLSSPTRVVQIVLSPVYTSEKSRKIKITKKLVKNYEEEMSQNNEERKNQLSIASNRKAAVHSFSAPRIFTRLIFVNFPSIFFVFKIIFP